MNNLYVREPDDAARGRVAAVAGGGLVLALLGALVWLASESPAPPAEAAVLPGAVRTAAVLPPASPAAGALVPPAMVLPMALPASSVVTVPAGQREVCGEGLVADADWQRPARREAFDGAVQATRRRTIASLTQSADPVARGLGLAMEADGAPRVALDARRCDGPDCVSAAWPAGAASAVRTSAADAADARDRAAARREAGAGPRDALARLAVDSRSAELYGLAWRSCAADGVAEASASCRMLSAEQWARLDPDNAVPWAAVLEQALVRRDASAATEALFRMSIARDVDNRAGRLPSVLAGHVPPGTPALESEAVLAGVAARSQGGWSALAARECTAAAVQDSNRWQRCDALAEVLWIRGRQPTDLAAALQIGQALGWPADRLAQRRDELMALAGATAEALAEADLSCAASRRRVAYHDEAGRMGAVAWARRAVASSGKPLSQWVAVAQARARSGSAADGAASGVVRQP